MNHASVNESRASENLYLPLAVTLVALGAAARLLPHWPNFTPVGGIGLFAGSRLRRSYAWTLPIAAMLMSDPLLSLVYGIRAFSIMSSSYMRASRSMCGLGAAGCAARDYPRLCRWRWRDRSSSFC